MATTRYLDAQVFGQPRDAGADNLQRVVFTFTMLFRKVDSDNFAEEVVAVLVGSNVGVFNENIFMGSVATVPIEDGPYIHLTEAGGTSNERIHNTNGPGYERPGLVVRVIAKDYIVCRNKARQAYRTLVSVCNQIVTFTPEE